MSDNLFSSPQVAYGCSEQNEANAADTQLTDFITKTGAGWMSAPSTAGTGLKDVQDSAMTFAQDNAESAFSFAGKICNAQSPQEILQIQAAFATERLHAFAAHAKELDRLFRTTVSKV